MGCTAFCQPISIEGEKVYLNARFQSAHQFVGINLQECSEQE